MNLKSTFTLFISLLYCAVGWCEFLTIVPGCSSLGSNVQLLSYAVAANGAGQTAYAWIDGDGVLHVSVTLAGETTCTELPNPNVQSVIPARSKPPQIAIDNLGNIKVAFLTATSNNFNLPPAAPQTINGLKVSTLNVNSTPVWTDISPGLNFTQSPTARGNGAIEISLAGNGEGDAMLIWFEEQAQFNDNIQAAIFNTGISSSPQWLTYTLDAGSNIASNSINSGNTKPTASINAAGKGMFFWLGTIDGSPIIQRHLRAAAVNAAQSQTLAPLIPVPQNVGHHVDFTLPSDGILAFAGTIDPSGDALAIWPDTNPNFSMMQYNTYSATTGLWGSQDPDRTIPGSRVTFQTESILMQLATDPNSSNSFAVWNQTQNIAGTTLFASAYNKTTDTWTPAQTVVELTSGEYSIGVDCQGDGIFVYRQGFSDILASVFPNISEASLANEQSLGILNPDGGVILLPITAIVQECLLGNTRMGAALWGDQVSAENIILQSAFFDLSNTPPPIVIPPSDFIGDVKKNKFATQTDIVNQLFWDPSPDPTVVGYLITGSDGSVANVSASGPFEVAFHNRHPHKTYTYTIVAFNANGQESNPLTVTLQTK